MMGRSRMSEIFRNEGLRWRQQEGWYGQKVDPEFAEKRASSRQLYTDPPETQRYPLHRRDGSARVADLRGQRADQDSRSACWDERKSNLTMHAPS